MLMLMLVGVSSCTKTEYTDYEEKQLNRILEYRVTNSQQELFGAIDNKNNTITVYIPYYSGIEYLNAEIKLDEGATLLDSTGKEINLDGGLDPVKVNADSVTVDYTVVPATGEKRTYTLIQKVMPLDDELHLRYANLQGGTTLIPAEDDSAWERPVNSRLYIVGNFESTSTNAKFILTDKATGKEYDDIIQAVEVIPGDNYYAMETHVSPEALPGEYTVHMEHQGRSTSLPDLTLFLQKYPPATSFLTSDSFAAGDTITFGVYAYHAQDQFTGVYKPVKRVYAKIRSAEAVPGDFSVPKGFPADLYDKEVEMEVLSQTRTEIKAVFPDLPVGTYLGSKVINKKYDDEIKRPSVMETTNFGFYADFEDGAEGWGKGYGIAYVSRMGFTVLEKK